MPNSNLKGKMLFLNCHSFYYQSKLGLFPYIKKNVLYLISERYSFNF